MAFSTWTFPLVIVCPAGWVTFWAGTTFLVPHPQPPPLALQEAAPEFRFWFVLVAKAEGVVVLAFSSATINEPVYIPIEHEKRIMPVWGGVNSKMFLPKFKPERMP